MIQKNLHGHSHQGVQDCHEVMHSMLWPVGGHVTGGDILIDGIAASVKKILLLYQPSEHNLVSFHILQGDQ